MDSSNRRDFLTATGIGLATVTALGCSGITGAGKKSEGLAKELDLRDIPIFDNHHHEYETEALTNPKPWSFAKMYYHGDKDDGSPADESGMSPKLNYHISQTGVVLATVAEMSQVFGCEATLAAVTAERYRRLQADAKGYSKMLYDKAKVKAIVIDSKGAETKGMPTLIPAKIYRLVANDFIFAESMKASDTLAGFRQTYIDAIANKLLDKDYIAIKCHIGERYGLNVVEIPLSESLAAYDKARKGDLEAIKKIYLQAFNDLAHYCCEKGVPIHIHTGSTGSLTDQPLGEILDPFLLAPYLKRPELKKLKIVLLHGGHPWAQHTALMAYNFPNVYLDMSWMFPWNVLGPGNYLNEFLGMAPLSKIFYGSGCHTAPEIAYLGGVVIRKVLTESLTQFVEKNYLKVNQANDVAHMILHKNIETFNNITI